MYFKLFIFCIHAVAATSHKHHLREKSGHHDIVFKGTKSQLHRLLKGDEEAKHAEALHVLRGSHRFLPGINCDYTDPVTNDVIKQDCDKDTEECKNDKCKEVCNAKKDCHGNGKCEDGECKCDEYFQDADDCSKQDVIWQVNVVSQSQLTGGEGEVEETRSPTCIEALSRFASLSTNLLENLSLPSAITVDSKSRRARRRRRLSGNSQRGPLVKQLNVVPGADCTDEGLTAQVLKAVDLALVEEEDPVLPDALVCLIDESKKILKHTDDEDGLEAELDALVTADECDVDSTLAQCVLECHDDIEDDCEDELESSGDEEGEDDCEGLHRDLKKCYEKCYGL